MDTTPAVSRALVLAQQLAQASQAISFEPRHVLLALLAEEEGRPASLLLRDEVTLPLLQTVLGQPSLLESGTDAQLLPSTLTQQALRTARRYARQNTEEESVTSDTLLLALLKVDAELAQSLAEIGVSVEALEAEILVAQGPALTVTLPLQLGPTPEELDWSRIVDACANRAREALRVIEDYCRFSLNDANLSGELKQLRHSLTSILMQLLPSELNPLQARDTLGDVGTQITTESEQKRYSLVEVAQVNLKRLQEALRSLEEFGKMRNSYLAAELEQLRYRSYTLEKALVLESDALARLAKARLYFLVTTSQCTFSLEHTVKEALWGGVELVQLRDKECTDQELLRRAEQVRKWTREAGSLFIMNDRVDIARLVDADGVHLGQDDLPVQSARRLLGTQALLGLSTHNVAQLKQAQALGVHYVGLGPTFTSGTKSFSELAGLEYLHAANQLTSLPAFAIGGITLDNLPDVLATGVTRVAVSQLLCQAEYPRAIAREVRRHLE